MPYLVLLIFFGVLAPPGRAAPARTALDSNVVRKLYMGGEFESATKLLEMAVKSGGLAAHADSVFAYKYLGVMYAAHYQTRETGKRYMYQLLSLEPTAKIMDMYASDMIYMIFKNIQEEIEINRARVSGTSDPPTSRPDSTSPRPKPPGPAGVRPWVWWTAAGLAVGTGLAVWYVQVGGSTAGGSLGGGFN